MTNRHYWQANANGNSVPIVATIAMVSRSRRQGSTLKDPCGASGAVPGGASDEWVIGTTPFLVPPIEPLHVDRDDGADLDENRRDLVVLPRPAMTRDVAVI